MIIAPIPIFVLLLSLSNQLNSVSASTDALQSPRISNYFTLPRREFLPSFNPIRRRRQRVSRQRVKPPSRNLTPPLFNEFENPANTIAHEDKSRKTTSIAKQTSIPTTKAPVFPLKRITTQSSSTTFGMKIDNKERNVAQQQKPRSKNLLPVAQKEGNRKHSVPIKPRNKGTKRNTPIRRTAVTGDKSKAPQTSNVKTPVNSSK